MRKISNVQYVDAYYLNENESVLNVSLPNLEAFGFMSVNENMDIILKFIDNYPLLVQNENQIVKGLIIPQEALKSNYAVSKINLEHLVEGNDVYVTWKDIVYVSNDERKECSIMYTEGMLKKIGKDYLLIENPETIRIFPVPIKNHPQSRPKYYVIPKGLIVGIDKN